MANTGRATEAYRKIVPSFWTDPNIKRTLTLEQKTLLLYLFTSPHSSMIGLYYLPLEYATAETGLSIETIRGHLGGALSDLVAYDEGTEEVFIFGMARHQIDDELKGGDKRKPMVERLLAGIHSGRLRGEFMRRYAGWDLKLPQVKRDTAPVSSEAPPQGASNGASNGASKGYPWPLKAPPHVPRYAIARAGAGTAAAAAPAAAAEGAELSAVSSAPYGAAPALPLEELDEETLRARQAKKAELRAGFQQLIEQGQPS